MSIRRWLLGAAAAALVAVPATAGADMTERERELYEGAKANGESVTWYVAHFSLAAAEAVGAAFRETYPDVPVNVVRTTAQVAFQRVNQELRAGTIQADVFSTTDPSHYVFLKEEDLLLEYRPDNSDKVYPAYRKGHDPDGKFAITHVALVVMSRNRDLVPDGDAPRVWADLTDPKYKGMISMGHPSFSGRAGVWSYAMFSKHGKSFFEGLDTNDIQVGRSMNDPLTLMNSGERRIGVTSLHSTRMNIQRGNPLALIFPEDGAILMEDPSGIIKTTNNPNAAKLFVEFLLSPAMSRVMIDVGGEPMRPEVPLPDHYTPIDDIETFRVPIDGLREGIQEVQELWRDIFGT